MYYDTDVFNVNTPYCPTDVPIMKRLDRTAKQQKKTEKMKEIKADPSRLQKVVERYHETCGTNEDVASRLLPWSWAQYEEYERAEKQTRRRLRGVMMHEEPEPKAMNRY